MHVSQTESLPVSSQVEMCSSQCVGFGTDGLVGFAHALKAGQMDYFCFCYYDRNAILPLEATSTNLQATAKGRGHPTASPTSPTASPTQAPTRTSYFSDNVFSLVGLGHCLDGQGEVVSSGAGSHSADSVGDCSDKCIASMGSSFVGFGYNHAESNCVCLYSNDRVESSDNAEGEICFKYIGNWPTMSPTVSPKPTTPPSMSPSTSPTSSPSGTPTSRPSQPQTTEDNFFDFVGKGRCTDSEDLQYTVRTYSTSDRDTMSANRCGEICRAHFESSQEFIVGFEITEGVSCNCLVSEPQATRRRRLGETQTSRTLQSVAWDGQALGFIYEGVGMCLDSNSKRFNHKWVDQITPDGCATACIELGHLAFLVGFSLDNAYKCHCEYTDGPSPPGPSSSWLDWTGGNGIGPVGGSAVNNQAADCYSYEFFGQGPGSIWSMIPFQTGSASTIMFTIAYTDGYNTGSFSGKCVSYDVYGDLILDQYGCDSANTSQQYRYNADKTLTVQGGAKSGQCVWSDRATYPKLKACPAGTPEDDLVWEYDNGQLKSNGGSKCLVTFHGTVSSHTPNDVDYRLTMRDCPVFSVPMPTFSPTGMATLSPTKSPISCGADKELKVDVLTDEYPDETSY
ncbi:hypothetical protein THAOC_32248, partial [Thalassiosira oceanica]